MDSLKGIIVKAIAGFCYVEVGNTVYECKPRGSFRKNSLSPSVGDIVTISLTGEKGVIESIEPRTNYLVRPPLANLDKLFIVSSFCVPSVNTLLIDRMIAVLEHINVIPVIVFNKADMGDFGELPNIYSSIGYKTYVVSAQSGEGIDELKKELSGCVSAFSGNSGVGKSSILNHIFPDLKLSTGVVSEKLGRGRHTTRQVELIKFNEGYVADTPGFSTLELSDYNINDKDELQFLFKEFGECFGKCFFSSCSHVSEKGCEVLKRINDGSVSRSRHENYVSMYETLKKINPWEIKK